MQAMHHEFKGGSYNFGKTLTDLCLLSCVFGGHITKSNGKYFHSHPGKALAISVDISKNILYLWEEEFTVITDQ